MQMQLQLLDKKEIGVIHLTDLYEVIRILFITINPLKCTECLPIEKTHVSD